MPGPAVTQRTLYDRLRLKLGRALLPHLRQAQDEVQRCNPLPYYAAHYQHEEIAYWLPIPAWLRWDYRARPPRQALDIGCAYGTLAVYCRLVWGCPVYCLDMNPGVLSPDLIECRQLHFVVSNVELDPLPWPGPFDLIIMTEVLEHFNFHPLPTLTRLRQALSSGGRLYLSTPDAAAWGRQDNLYPGLDQLPPPTPGAKVIDYHIYLYTLGELLGLAQAAGFAIHRVGYAPGTVYRHICLVLQNEGQLQRTRRPQSLYAKK